tara:strand:+ start:495 stop:659 length:165 start_codon:yes stop_codon:yes gene_type:complete
MEIVLTPTEIQFVKFVVMVNALALVMMVFVHLVQHVQVELINVKVNVVHKDIVV